MMDIVQLSAHYKPVVDAVAAFLGPITALAVAFIAFQQWQTSKQKEDRQLREAELGVYHRVRRFLRSVDETRKVDAALFEDFRESVAEADFLFPPSLCEWLGSIELDASSWLDGHTRVTLWINEGQNEADPWVVKEQAHMERNIEAMQTAHCELLSNFRNHVRAP